jgi:hypothetical protein
VCSVTLDKEGTFVECLLSWHSAKKALVAPMSAYVPRAASWHLVKGASLLSVRQVGTRQREHPVPLPSVGIITLGKKTLLVFKCAFFAVLWS